MMRFPGLILRPANIGVHPRTHTVAAANTYLGRGDDDFPESGTSLRDYAAILRRQLWLVLLILVLTPILAYAITASQSAVYEASADVVIGGSGGAPSIGQSTDAERFAATQERLARLPAVARRVIASEQLDETASAFLGHSSVSVTSGADVLTFSVRDGDPSTAIRLASSYAHEFTLYRTSVEHAAIAGARKDLQTRMKALAAAGRKETPLYRALAAKDQQLAAAAVLPDLGAVVVQPAAEATQISPHPARNTVLGLGLGVLLALGAAFLAEALDTRVRSADEVERRLQRPILGLLPAADQFAGRGRPLMLTDPNGSDAEAVRMLRASFDFVRIESKVRSVMFSSFGDLPDKPAVAGNLAIALARAGRNVTLCDLDCRNPTIGRMFGVEGVGITDAALRETRLAGALARIPITGAAGIATPSVPARGSLTVVPLGTMMPPSPADFVGSQAVADVLTALASEADVLLVEAPPMLAVSDPIALSANVDGMILVGSLPGLTRDTLSALDRALTASAAPLLGVVLLEGGEASSRPEAVGRFLAAGSRAAGRSWSYARPRVAAAVGDLHGRVVTRPPAGAPNDARSTSDGE
jgi:capsular polysaccharide biosynthesis protein/Mrp family chromosome partitioning ATPase